MPVLGMMSVFDWSEADNVKGGWTGREWFVVNKARLLVLPSLSHIPGLYSQCWVTVVIACCRQKCSWRQTTL